MAIGRRIETAVIEATVDCLRGIATIDRVGIVHDAGRSLNPVIDTGQIDRGFRTAAQEAETLESGTPVLYLHLDGDVTPLGEALLGGVGETSRRFPQHLAQVLAIFEVGVALIGAAVTAYILGILLNQQQDNAAAWRSEIRRRIGVPES